MQRLLWLALVSLLGISCLFAARTVASVTAIKGGAPNAIAPDAANDDLPLAKGDRLPSPFFDVAVPKTVVDIVKITPTDRRSKRKRKKMKLRAGTGTKARRSSVVELQRQCRPPTNRSRGAINLKQQP